jgi:hypothetical protein
MIPVGLRNKNDCAAEGQQQFSRDRDWVSRESEANGRKSEVSESAVTSRQSSVEC